MPKHIDIIRKLTEAQKLGLAADLRRLSDPALAELGVPHTDIARLEDYFSTGDIELPAPESSVNSWNTELMTRIAEEATCRALADGKNFVIAPDLRVRPDIDASGASEDPELCGRACAAYLGGISSAGGIGCFSDYAVHSSEAAALDIEPDKRSLAEYVLEPLRVAAENADFGYVASSSPMLKDGYAEINSAFVPTLLPKVAGNKTSVRLDAAPSDTVRCITGGSLCIGGSAQALFSALDNYRKSSVGADGAVCSPNGADIDSGGSVLSDEILDEAVDRVLDLAFKCAAKEARQSRCDASALASDAAEQSTVMLKNDGALPYASRSVAIIGPCELLPDLRESASRSNRNGVKFEFAEGYSLSSDTDMDVYEALDVAGRADGIVVLLGSGEERRGERSVLPANRVAIVRKLAETNKKVTAVVVGSSLPDMSFDVDVNAVLFVPRTGARRGEALLNIITGRVSPSGRLAFSGYDNADEYFGYLKRNRNAGIRKVGSFAGYRYYDLSGDGVKYPFGHGLTYSEFEYSGLKAEHGEISFTVANVGKTTASEVAQVYIGKPHSALVRPKKILKGFAKVRLRPGEKTVVTIRPKPNDLAVFDSETSEMRVEHGEYTVYVGASVADIKLTAEIAVRGELLEKDKKTMSSYIKNKSDTDKSCGLTYRAPDVRRTPAGVFAIIMSVVSLICDLVYLAVGIVSEVEQWKDRPFASGSSMFAVNIVVLVLLNVLFIASVVAVVITKTKADKRAAEAERIAVTRDSWDVTELDGEVSIGELFVDDEVPSVSEKVDERENDVRIRFDKSVDFGSLATKLSEHMRDCGVTADASASRRVLSALSSSKLVVFRMKDDTIAPFLSSLVSFFGCMYFGSEGNATDVIPAMEAASVYPHNVCFSSLTGVGAEALDAYYAPFMRHLAGGARKASAVIGGQKYDIPANIWFICGLSGETDRMSLRIADAAATVDLDVGLNGRAGMVNPFVGVGYEQFVTLGDMSAGRLDFDENKWKKLDRIIALVSSRREYRIGNKLWRSMERYIAVLTECGAGGTEALDTMIADRLIHGMALRVSGKFSADDGSFLRAIESVLGEDNIPACRKTLKRFGLSDIV